MPQRWKVYEGNYPYFITCSVTYWIPIFGRDDRFKILADSLTYCIENKGLRVHSYVIMPTHFHATISHPEGAIPDVMRDMKRHTSIELAKTVEGSRNTVWLNAFRKAAGGNGMKVWDDEYHPEQIQTREFCQQKMDYIHDNPCRAGFVNDPCAWKYSSAGFYLREQESIVPITLIDW